MITVASALSSKAWCSSEMTKDLLSFISVCSPQQGASQCCGCWAGWLAWLLSGREQSWELSAILTPPDISPQVQLFLLLQGNPSPSAALILWGCHPVSSSAKLSAVHSYHPSGFPQWASHQMPEAESHLPAFPACCLTLSVRQPSRWEQHFSL